GAPAPQGPPQGFAFEDRTGDVGLIGANGVPYYGMKVLDHHTVGGAFVDLDGDGFPDLVLPRPREDFPTGGAANQPEGGVLIVPNRPNAAGAVGREFDWDARVEMDLGGAESQGILAFDADDDGDLDLFVICSGLFDANDQTPFDPSLYDSANLAGSFPGPFRNRLLINRTNEPLHQQICPGAAFCFTDETGATDPDGTASEDGHGLAHSEEPGWVVADPANPGQVLLDPTRTAFTTASAAAAAADVNRDGRIDLFVAQHTKHIREPYRDFRLSGQMASLHLNLGVDDPASPSKWWFWDVSYDRRKHPQVQHFDPNWNSEVAPYNRARINWDEFKPVYGWQGADDHFVIPNDSRPWARFGGSVAVAFTDLNNDRWPDLIVTTKAGFALDPPIFAQSAPYGGMQLVFPMIYINRGNDENGRWLGYWNRTWDMVLQLNQLIPKSDPHRLRRNLAPMGLGVGDSDMDGDMDFYVTDWSNRGELLDRSGYDSAKYLDMGNDYYRNDTGSFAYLPGYEDLSFFNSGNEVYEAADPNSASGFDLHGPAVLPTWLSWGTLFADFDNDGDNDVWVASMNGEEVVAQGDPGFILDPLFATLGDDARAWDRFFRNETAQAAGQPVEPSERFTDINPAPHSNAEPWMTRVARRKDSRGALGGDMDQDGRLDLLVMPSPFHQFRYSTQFLHNESVNGNASLTVRLGDPENVCPQTSRMAVGSRVEVIAKLDGANAVSQYAELRIGENISASTHSLPLEFGLGQQPMDQAVQIVVTWPCGFRQTLQHRPDQGLSMDVEPDSHTHRGRPEVEIRELDVPTLPVRPEDGAAPVWVRARVNSGVDAAWAELSMARAGEQEAFQPVAMDHGLAAGAWFDLPAVPLLLPMNHDAAGLPVETPYKVRVRAMGEDGQTSSEYAAENLRLMPERVPASGDPLSGWILRDGAFYDPVRQEFVLPPWGFVAREYTFPGFTDYVDYDLVVDGGSLSGLQTGSLKVQLANKQLISSAQFIAVGEPGRSGVRLTAQPMARSNHWVGVRNVSTNGETVRIRALERARVGSTRGR
ncbi:MAG TPA: ASPIC/UnbV domain-containing protein, partial [Planctomycetota bacterium]